MFQSVVKETEKVTTTEERLNKAKKKEEKTRNRVNRTERSKQRKPIPC